MSMHPAPAPVLDSKKEIRSWALYDWANSAFVTVLITALGGPYLTGLANAAATDGQLALGPVTIAAGSLWAYATSLSVILQVLTLPLLGAMSDRGDRRKLLTALTLVGGAGAVGFALAPSWLLAAGAIVVANLAYGGAITVYNSYLGEITSEGRRHAVSAQGFALGYLGGGVVLALALGVVLSAEAVGLDKADAVRYGMIGAGLWWAAFGVIAARGLRATEPKESATSALGEIKEAVGELRRLPHTRRYLTAFLLFNDAIQAVVGLSAVFLTQELFVAKGRDAEDATTFVIGLVLLIQFVAVVGAWLYGKAAYLVGAKRALLSTIVVWTLATTYAAVLLTTTTQAWALGVVIALVLGGSQAIARSMYTTMIPKGREGAFFSLYEVAERGTAWIGTLTFGIVLQMTGSYRGAIFSLVVLLVAGGLLLARTDTDQAAKDAGNDPSGRDVHGPDQLDWEAPTPGGERLYSLALRIARTLLAPTTRRSVDVVGEVPAGGVIVVGNHVSVADPLVLATALESAGRRVRMMGTAGLVASPVVGTMLRKMGHIPVYRHGRNAAKALEPALQALRAGEAVGLYPEGRITVRDDVLPGEVKTGVVRLALLSGAPILPVVQWGTHELAGHTGWTRSVLAAVRRPVPVAVQVGPPIDLTALLQLSGEPSREDLARGAAIIQAALTEAATALRDQAGRALPTQRRADAALDVDPAR